MRCHYLTDGTVNFAFTMRRAEYFIPAGILLKCFLEVSDGTCLHARSQKHVRGTHTHTHTCTMRQPCALCVLVDAPAGQQGGGRLSHL